MKFKRYFAAFLLVVALSTTQIAAQSDPGNSDDISVTKRSSIYIGVLVAAIVAATAIGIGGDKTAGDGDFDPISP